MGRKKNLPLIPMAEIVDIAAEGKAIARIDGMVIFVPYVVPGDVVDVQVYKKRKKYMEALPVHFHKYSTFREQPVCSHFGTCGGCKWQNLPYARQLYYKEKQVFDNLTRIGKLDIEERYPILGSEKQYFYRNKLEFTFSRNRWLTREEIDSELEYERRALGFHIPEKFDKVLDIDKCWLQADPSNLIRNSVKEFAFEQQLSFFDLRKQEGFLRNLIIRRSLQGELMVIFSFFHEDEGKRIKLLDHIAWKFPEISSLMYLINPKVNDSFSDLEVKLYRGKDHIIEVMEGLRFRVGPKSFYQTNSEQAYNLYKIVREFAEISVTDTVYDLYTGTGTIANFVAGRAGKVIGIEYIGEAIEDAKFNSQLNNISNTSFFEGDIKDVLTLEFIEKHGSPDVLILDPPRAGVHPNVIETILLTMPRRIVYVSCNPATQARDLALLKDEYRIRKVQPVDMFPQTHHVENVVLIDKI